MSFELSQIDRAIEWAIKDEIIRQGLWPDERTFQKNQDLEGLEKAVGRIDTPIKVFGVGALRFITSYIVILNLEGSNSSKYVP